jgi:hypothetical protein
MLLQTTRIWRLEHLCIKPRTEESFYRDPVSLAATGMITRYQLAVLSHCSIFDSLQSPCSAAVKLPLCAQLSTKTKLQPQQLSEHQQQREHAE